MKTIISALVAIMFIASPAYSQEQCKTPDVVMQENTDKYNIQKHTIINTEISKMIVEEINKSAKENGISEEYINKKVNGVIILPETAVLGVVVLELFIDGCAIEPIAIPVAVYEEVRRNIFNKVKNEKSA
jgi:hypothetical protein